MTTIHLTDVQRDQLAACGLIVVDGVAGGTYAAHDIPRGITMRPTADRRVPGNWRRLTEPCPTCYGDSWEMLDKVRCPDPDCVGGRRVVTLTATCPVEILWVYEVPPSGGYSVATCVATTDGRSQRWYSDSNYVTDRERSWVPDFLRQQLGVVTLGRFTIPALLPVLTDTRPWPRGLGWWNGWILDVKHDPNADTPDGPIENLNDQQLLPDPLPQPGQFIARPEPVPT